MGLNKSAIAGLFLTATALVLSACTTHHASHPTYREVGPAHHRGTTVVHPPARHRTVIVRPPARHRTVIVHPPARHRTVIVRPSKRDRRHIRRHRRHEAARAAKRRYHKKYRAEHRNRDRVRHGRATSPKNHRSSRVGSTRDPRKVLRSGPVRGHISGGRPGRPDVVMPKARPHGKRTSQALKRKHRKSAKSKIDERSKSKNIDRLKKDDGD